MLIILKSVPETMEQYRNLSQSTYILVSEPVTITSSLQSAFFFFHHKDYNAEGVRLELWIRLPKNYIQKFSFQFVTIYEFELRFNEMERIYQCLTFLVNKVNSFPLIKLFLAFI